MKMPWDKETNPSFSWFIRWHSFWCENLFHRIQTTFNTTEYRTNPFRLTLRCEINIEIIHIDCTDWKCSEEIRKEWNEGSMKMNFLLESWGNLWIIEMIFIKTIIERFRCSNTLLYGEDNLWKSCVKMDCSSPPFLSCILLDPLGDSANSKIRWQCDGLQ